MLTAYECLALCSQSEPMPPVRPRVARPFLPGKLKRRQSRRTAGSLLLNAQYFAFLELATLSAEDAARRKSIFVDIKTEGGTGGAWHDLSRECLKLIGTELQRAKGRGVLPRTSILAYDRPSSANVSSLRRTATRCDERRAATCATVDALNAR